MAAAEGTDTMKDMQTTRSNTRITASRPVMRGRTPM
jgi:hypothetical protein